MFYLLSVHNSLIAKLFLDTKKVKVIINPPTLVMKIEDISKFAHFQPTKIYTLGKLVKLIM